MNGAIPPLPNTPSWHDTQLKKHRDKFTFTLPWMGDRHIARLLHTEDSKTETNADITNATTTTTTTTTTAAAVAATTTTAAVATTTTAATTTTTTNIS
jgi:hypothetical protein